MKDMMFRQFKIRVAIIMALIFDGYTWSEKDGIMYLWTKGREIHIHIKGDL